MHVRGAAVEPCPATVSGALAHAVIFQAEGPQTLEASCGAFSLAPDQTQGIADVVQAECVRHLGIEPRHDVAPRAEGASLPGAPQKKGPGFLRAPRIGICSVRLPADQAFPAQAVIEHQNGAQSHDAEVSCDEGIRCEGTKRKQDGGYGDCRRGDRTDDVGFHVMYRWLCPCSREQGTTMIHFPSNNGSCSYLYIP